MANHYMYIQINFVADFFVFKHIDIIIKMLIDVKKAKLYIIVVIGLAYWMFC